MISDIIIIHIHVKFNQIEDKLHQIEKVRYIFGPYVKWTSESAVNCSRIRHLVYYWRSNQSVQQLLSFDS